MTTMRETVNTEPVTLESVLAKENLNAAWSQVKAKDGTAGVDGREVARSFPRIRQAWTGIAAALLAGHDLPAAVRAVTIPKANGGERTLGIPGGAGSTDPASDPPAAQSGLGTGLQ